MRIWVTGVGVVSPLGRGAGTTMDRLLRGDRAVRELSLFPTEGLRSNLAAEVADTRAEDVDPGGSEDGWSRTDAFAIGAAREALAHAGIDSTVGTHSAAGVDVVLGGTTAGMYETEDLLAQLAKDPSSMGPLRRMLSHPLSSTADHLVQKMGSGAKVRSLCSACSSGANAAILGASWLASGRSKIVLAGGADGLCRLTYTGFAALAAMSAEPCRPFDRRRSGLNLGEGAAFLVLERAEDAMARGAEPLAELAGFGVGAEAHHITNPEKEGRTAARVMSQALARAGLTPADVDYINAHGTATPLNDSMETTAIRACFGPEAERVRVSSSKGQIGHTLGAAGAIEAAITVLAIRRGVLPPTIGLEEVDDACRLQHVLEATEAPVRAALSNSFGFGGTDTALLFKRIDELPARRSVAAVPAPSSRHRVVVTACATVGPLGVLGGEANRAYAEAGASPQAGSIAFEAKEHLDIARARRLDRAGRLTTVVIQKALEEAGIEGEARHDVGAIMGSSFGSVDASTAYMRRIYDKGAKFASPADFPNLVPSSPVGHASIYLGLRGTVFSVADLAMTAESAVATAAELVAAGNAPTLAAGSVEEASPTIELVLGPLCSGIAREAVRSEGASVLLLESAEAAGAAGRSAWAELSWWSDWRTSPERGARVFDAAPEPGPGDVVMTSDASAVDALLMATPWADVPRHRVSARSGTHEGAGGFAAAAAIAMLRAGRCKRALVIGGSEDRGYAFIFAAPSEDA